MKQHEPRKQLYTAKINVINQLQTTDNPYLSLSIGSDNCNPLYWTRRGNSACIKSTTSDMCQELRNCVDQRLWPWTRNFKSCDDTLEDCSFVLIWNGKTNDTCKEVYISAVFIFLVQFLGIVITAHSLGTYRSSHKHLYTFFIILYSYIWHWNKPTYPVNTLSVRSVPPPVSL